MIQFFGSNIECFEYLNSYTLNVLRRYLLKQWTTLNDLKWPTTTWNKQETTWNKIQRSTTSKKWPETTYNEQETTWNNLQWVRHNLQWPEHTYNKQQQASFQVILQYGANGSLLYHIFHPTFDSVIQASLHRESWWKQNIKHLLSCVKCQLSCVFFTGYKIHFFLSGFSVSRERERLFF